MFICIEKRPLLTPRIEFGGHSTNPNVHNRAATSLPSEETTGAHPGEESGGVGALPGSKFAEGVAVLPEERAVDGDDAAQSHEGRGVAQIKTLASTHESSGDNSSSTKHEGYAPSGPAMGLSSTPTYQQETGHSQHAHGHGQETYEAPHRSLTEIIKDGAQKADEKKATGRAHEGYAPSGPAVDLSASSGVASASKTSGDRVVPGGSYELGGLSGQHGKSSEGYAPSGPAVGLGGSNTEESTSRDATTGHAKKPSYELGGLSGASTTTTSQTKTSEGYAPSGPAVGLGGSKTEETTSRDIGSSHAKKPSYGFGGLSSASNTNTQTETLPRVESTGAHTMSASSGITRPEQSSTGNSGTTTTTTTHTSGSGYVPDYDLAPPLGAIVGSTPLTSHIETDRSHNPVLPGNIPAALTHEPVAVHAPSESTTANTQTAVEQSQGPSSRGSTYNSKDSDVVSPGSTIDSEPTHGSAVNPALAAARFQAPKPDRVDSSASTTAIIHGKPGNPHHEKQASAGSSLAAVTEKGKYLATRLIYRANSHADLPKTPQTEVIQSSPTSHSTTTNTATRAPGTETGAVGGKDLTTANSEPHKHVKEEFAAVGHGTLDKPASSLPAKEAPKTESSAVPGQVRTTGAASATTAPTGDYVPSQHARTGSSGSGASKRSFLDKVCSVGTTRCTELTLLSTAQGQDPPQEALDERKGNAES